jgi:colanic acid/amylovoran biosynthesis glycosyltransferase
MLKPRLGVYRTVYPNYSETFISEQIRCYENFQPVLICRELNAPVVGLQTVSLGEKWQFVKKLGFSAFGLSFGFDDFNSLRGLRLIHAHFAPDAALVLPIAKKLKIPLFVTCHGSDITVTDIALIKSMKLSAYRYLLARRHLIRYTSLFMTCSDFLREKMISKGYPAEKVVRHYLGIDTTRFIPALQNSNSPQSAPFFLSIARHTDVKGLDILLRAFALVLIDYPDLRLVQIGGGALTGTLKALALELGVDKNVDFLGPQSSEQVLPYLQACLAVVLSSRKSASGAEEAFGLVLAEAAACEVPCIGTRVGGIPEAVIDGETGFLTEPENVQDLAEKMKLLFANPELRKRMGKRGREMACDIFDIKKQTKKLEKLYSGFIPS